MKQYLIEFAHPSGPMSLIAATVAAPSVESAIRIVHDRLLEIVSKQPIPKVTEYSAEIDKVTASMLCSAFQSVTGNDPEKLAVLISALEPYSSELAARLRELLNPNA